MPLAPHEPEQCAADSTQPAWRCMLKKLLHPSGDPAEINDPASVTEVEEREVGERATEVQEIVGRRSTTPIRGAHPLNTTIKHADPAESGGQRARSEAQAPAAPGIEASSPRSVATAPQQQMGKEGSGPTSSPIDLGRRVRVEGYADGDVKYVGYVRWTGRDGIKRSRFRIGVELDRAVGLNNGTVDSVTYFSCAEHRGVFVVPCKITLLEVMDRGQTLQRRRSENWETESMCSTFSLISLATVHSLNSEFDITERAAPASSPSCSTSLQCGGEYIMLPTAESF